MLPELVLARLVACANSIPLISQISMYLETLKYFDKTQLLPVAHASVVVPQGQLLALLIK